MDVYIILKRESRLKSNSLLQHFQAGAITMIQQNEWGENTFELLSPCIDSYVQEMHIDDADIETFGDKTEWDPNEKAELIMNE